MTQNPEYIKQIVANREKGNYHIEDMSEDENYDPSKVYWSCFSESPSGNDCILIYAFDRKSYGDKCPAESSFDNAEYAIGTISCSSWK